MHRNRPFALPTPNRRRTMHGATAFPIVTDHSMPRLPLLLAAVLSLAACAAPPSTPPGGRVAELQIIDQQVGAGAIAAPGAEVTVHYSGWLYDAHAADQRGARFDSSVDRGQPFTFRLGTGRVIRGWDDGVTGMRVGGKRLLLIPPEDAYGSKGAGGGVIPPGASLVFEIELLDVQARD